jgi:hypothetical protein
MKDDVKALPDDSDNPFGFIATMGIKQILFQKIFNRNKPGNTKRGQMFSKIKFELFIVLLAVDKESIELKQ